MLRKTLTQTLASQLSPSFNTVFIDNDEDVKEDQNKKDESKKDQNTNDEIEEDENELEQAPRDQKSPQARNAKTAASTYEEKQRQLLLADCQRLKKKMTEVKNSIERPPL